MNKRPPELLKHKIIHALSCIAGLFCLCFVAVLMYVLIKQSVTQKKAYSDPIPNNSLLIRRMIEGNKQNDSYYINNTINPQDYESRKK